MSDGHDSRGTEQDFRRAIALLTMQQKMQSRRPGDLLKVVALGRKITAVEPATLSQARNVIGASGAGLAVSANRADNAEVEVQHTGPGKPPIKTASGVDALRALKVLQTAQPFTYTGGALGAVTLTPGTAINGKILLYASTLEIYYIDGQNVYEAYAPDFVRDIWLTAFAQGAANAAWLVPLAKAEFALIEGLIAPWYLMLGMSIFEGLVFVHEHLADIKLLLDHYQTVLEIRAKIKAACPTLYDKCFWAALHEVVRDLPDGVELADVAYFVGRVFGGSGIVGKIEEGTRITVKVVAKIVLEYAVLIALIHGPAIAARGVRAALRGELARFKQQMASEGIPLSDEEAMKILEEMTKSENLKDVVNHLGEVSKAIEEVMGRLKAAADKEMP